MFRFGVFWLTGLSILMLAGLFPTPSSDNFPKFLQSESVALENIAPPKVMAQLDNLAGAFGGHDGPTQPEIAEPAKDKAPRVLVPSDISKLVPPSEAPNLPEPGNSQLTEIIRKITDRRHTVVGSIVNFDLDAAKLDSLAMTELDHMAIWLLDNPTAEIGIFGHTDLTGTEVYNDGLGWNRANEVARYLINNGITPDRINVVKSYGESTPKVATEGKSRENRRVQVETIGTL